MTKAPTRIAFDDLPEHDAIVDRFVALSGQLEDEIWDQSRKGADVRPLARSWGLI